MIATLLSVTIRLRRGISAMTVFWIHEASVGSFCRPDCEFALATTRPAPSRG